jgi:hypothetical protein
MAFMRTSTSVEKLASVPVFLEASPSGEAVWLLAEPYSVARVVTWLIAFFAGRISGSDCSGAGWG